jgi:D-serine dehydratase
MDLDDVFHRPLDDSNKGVPGPVTPRTARETGWNLLADDLPYPVMILLDTAVEHNIRTMSRWCERHGFLFAPHGKTTVCPQLFQRQLQAGAWGITVATSQQARVCVKYGVRRILMANQLVGRANIRSIASSMSEHPDLEFVCVVDSTEGADHLAAHLRELEANRPVGVLLEGGREDWRTGVRSVEEARSVLAAIQRHPAHLEFRGFEGYEGIARLQEGAHVKEYLDGLIRMSDAIARALPAPSARYLFSVGGTSFLDYQHEMLPALKDRYQVVVRSGCHVSHDHGLYPPHVQRARDRGMGEEAWPAFRPALELWSLVQSVRDGRTAILTFGRRDAPHDAELPVPLKVVRPGQSLPQAKSLEGAKVTRLNDQHAFMTIPRGIDLHVGDRVACGIVHPCTAFDKWAVLPLLDDAYRVLDLYCTYF